MLCRARATDRTATSLLDLPGGGLRAPVGTDPAPVYLDIREAAKGGIGPHGLCVGATGSGNLEPR
jgi:S-DNA-T family DNA segregation ATPase FtsK/SpoIIIE